MENAKLAKEKRSYREEHSLNKQLQATIKQNTKDIAKLTEDNNSLKETNDFLSNQVNNLLD
jgi:cell division protein FtsB